MLDQLPSDVVTTLEALAKESNTTPLALLIELIKKTDEERHVEWDRKQRQCVRRPCPRPNCFEKH